MKSAPTCALCLRRCVEGFVQDRGRTFCPPCLVAIGTSATNPGHRARLWEKNLPTENHRLAQAPLRKDKDPAAKAVSDELDSLTTPFSFEEVAQLKPSEVPESDAQTHLNLAVAYAEMGLSDDALGEFGIALRHHQHLPPQEVVLALSRVLDPRWLTLSMDDTLTAMRNLMFAN